MDRIELEQYLQYSLELKPREEEIRRALMEVLPMDIIDCHVHCNLADHVGDLSDELRHRIMSTFPSFSLEESMTLRSIFFPQRRVRSLRFPHALPSIDHRSANQYLIDNCNADDRVALFGLPDDIGYTTTMLEHPRISALKMYRLSVNPYAGKIYDYFRPEILEVAQALKKPIILHLPKIITQCREDLRQLINDFPSLVIVLAHLGSPHLPVEHLLETYQEVARCDNIFLDTAMIPSSEVVALALQSFGPSRIMYGSDEPLNLVRAKVFSHPEKGQWLITEYPYHWVDQVDQQRFAHLAQGVVHMHWPAIEAVIIATKQLFGSCLEAAWQKIFHNNAKAVFGF